jgi:hypothetical protein
MKVQPLVRSTTTRSFAASYRAPLAIGCVSKYIRPRSFAAAISASLMSTMKSIPILHESFPLRLYDVHCAAHIPCRKTLGKYQIWPVNRISKTNLRFAITSHMNMRRFVIIHINDEAKAKFSINDGQFNNPTGGV